LDWKTIVILGLEDNHDSETGKTIMILGMETMDILELKNGDSGTEKQS